MILEGPFGLEDFEVGNDILDIHNAGLEVGWEIVQKGSPCQSSKS
jgi:hypothetical protein